MPSALGSDVSRYRLLVDSITDYAIYMIDKSGVVVSWNPGAERFKGYAADEIIGQHFSRFHTEEDIARGLPQLSLKTAAKAGGYETEGWRVRKDGSRFWAHVVIDPIRSADGELIGYAKITRDLTERRDAEEALRRSEEQFQLLVHSVTDYAIYMLDPQGRVSSWNLGAQRIKGYAPQEIIGQHFSKFYTPEDVAAGLPDHGLETARRAGRFEMEGWRVRKDGSRFWANVVIDAIRDDAGQVIGFAKVTRDVTERMEVQKALEQARERLFQSQKLEAIGQLTGGIAHDFNNLLMVVIGSLELVQKRMAPDPRIAAMLDNAMMGARRGATLTQRMLAFARRQEVKRESVDLPQLVNGMMGLMQRSLGPTVSILTQYAGVLPKVTADPNQLEAALLNLAVNARDAMPDGGRITLVIEAVTASPDGAADVAPGDYVRICVSDTGQGMDAATLAKATEPFFTTKGVGKGTGLGLSMVHGLAAQSGGALRLKSQPGQGTTAEIWLPVETHEACEAAAAACEPIAERSAPPLSIVVADDDALVLLNTVAMLEDLGHTVFAASSAAEALDILGREPQVDLVVTDQAMPTMTGAQLAAAARALRPGLPVLLATGYAELPSDGAPGLPRLAKPFLQAELTRAIAEVMKSSADDLEDSSSMKSAPRVASRTLSRRRV